MNSIAHLIKTTQLVGLGPMLKLRRAHRLAWPGMLNGFYSTRLIQTLLNIGFFDELDSRGRVNPAEFAAAHGYDEEILESMCHAMYAYSVLDRDGDGYRLTADGELISEVARGWFNGVYGYEGVFHELEGLVRKQRHYGSDIVRRGDFVAKGSGEIENWLYFPIAIDYVKKNGMRRVVDLGCGEGTFLRHMCHRVPQVAGFGLDLSPEAIDDGRAKLREEGLSDRIQLFVHDITNIEGRPKELHGIELGTAFFVLHELLYNGQNCVVEFLQAYRRLFPTSPLMVFEVDRPTPEEMRKRPGMAIPYFLQHDLSHQKPIAKDDWLPIFRAAGFKVIDRLDMDFARSVCFTIV